MTTLTVEIVWVGETLDKLQFSLKPQFLRVLLFPSRLSGVRPAAISRHRPTPRGRRSRSERSRVQHCSMSAVSLQNWRVLRRLAAPSLAPRLSPAAPGERGAARETSSRRGIFGKVGGAPGKSQSKVLSSPSDGIAHIEGNRTCCCVT